MNDETKVSKYSPLEETGNTITHALACAFVVWGLVGSENILFQLLAFSTGLTFLFSSLYHGTALLNLKPSIVDRFRMMDILSIYVTVAMTGLTWGLKVETNPVVIFSLLFPIALLFFWVARNYKTTTFEDSHTGLVIGSGLISSTIFYLGNWSTPDILYFTGGILLYAIGAGFYVIKNKEWAHSAWHIMVGLAALCHLIGIKS